jgi:hypothetical protein
MVVHGEPVPREELCIICEKAYDSHDGRKMTIDAHVEQFLDERKVSVALALSVGTAQSETDVSHIIRQ